MSGTITALNVEEDNVFEGGTIYEIQDVHNFIVDATVDEYDVVNLEKGQTAYVKTDSLGNESWRARSLTWRRRNYRPDHGLQQRHGFL